MHACIHARADECVVCYFRLGEGQVSPSVRRYALVGLRGEKHARGCGIKRYCSPERSVFSFRRRFCFRHMSSLIPLFGVCFDLFEQRVLSRFFPPRLMVCPDIQPQAVCLGERHLFRLARALCSSKEKAYPEELFALFVWVFLRPGDVPCSINFCCCCW